MRLQDQIAINNMRLEGHSPSMIAAKLGLPAGTVRSHIHRHPNIPGTKACKNCGRPLMQPKGRREKMFCSDFCRMAWWNSHQEDVRRKAFYNLVCQHCGTVNRIFTEYLAGSGMTAIAKRLNADGIPTRYGNTWGKASIKAVLQNYAYTGNLLLQKSRRVDHLTKRDAPNNGELPQYHVQGCHEAIIPLRLFNAVQEEMRHRADKHTHPGEKRKEYPFSGKLICACCGKHYRRKITATGPKWVCTTFNTMGKAACPSKQIPEDTLITATEEVIGSIDAIDNKITAVRVENDNTLVFCLADGTEIVKRWQDRSRQESWTPEMKEAARRREMERRQQHDTT